MKHACYHWSNKLNLAVTHQLIAGMIETLGALVLVAVLWGASNPFIRQGTKGLREVTADTKLGQFYAEVKYLISNWQYVVPWLVNQAGSLVYLVTLGRTALSLAVPATHGLTLVTTALVGWALGEEPLTARSFLGILLVVTGTALCYTERSH